MTQSRISQIKDDALRRMREGLAAQYGEQQPTDTPARLVLFVATGASKAGPLRRAFADPPDVPAGLVVGEERTVWLVDEPAAAEVAEAEAAAVENLYG